MLIPEPWLRSFCNPPIDSDQLAHALTMAGLEVEDVRRGAPPFHGVVVGEILTCERHPNADRLSVCSVDAGQGVPLQIVCGAPNARAGIRVPCALVGAELPAGADGAPLRIRQARMRGVDSAGMLCSARELGISDEASGLLELAPDAPVGGDLRTYLRLDDAVFEIKLTPNRADALSVYGVAREVAAVTGAPLAPEPRRRVQASLNETLPVQIEAADLCGRFAGRVIRGVDARAATPAWMRERLQRAGQRSISALVDISNYVMLELGRPSHVFDLDRVRATGATGLVVRWAHPGESLELLNGQTVALDASVGVIAAGDTVESLAGIMGGEATAVTLDTRNVYVEAAFWHPEAIQGRARRFGFTTDAGHRFERGVDWATITEHLDLITGLIQEICGGDAGPIDDQTLSLPARPPVTLRVARARKVIGIDVDADLACSVFARLGFEYTRAGQGAEATITVLPPSYRFDLAVEEDLIEEIARIHGFDRIPAQPPLARAAMRARAETRASIHALRAKVASHDYFEVINYAFVDAAWETDVVGNPDPIRLLNPIASQMAVMRSSLIPGLLANVRHNAHHRADRVRVFEIGKAFSRDASVVDGPLTVAGVAQPLMLAGAAWGLAAPEQWASQSRAVDFFDVKGDLAAILPTAAKFEAHPHPLFHPGRAARIVHEGKVIGIAGELHPRHLSCFDLAQPPIVFELAVEPLLAHALPQHTAVPRHPVVRRDLALVVDGSVAASHVLGTLRAEAPGIVRELEVFDIYRGSGLASTEKSVAIRILMQDSERTLSDSEIDEVCRRLLAVAQEKFGARLRA